MKEQTELSKAFELITNELRNDPEYRFSWVANIAVSYKDNENWYKQKTGKKFLNRQDKHVIANNAAEYFINQLCKL